MDRSWLASYPAGLPHEIVPEHTSLLSMLEANVGDRPDAPALHYFDTTTSWAELDAASEALAGLLRSRGFRPGERLALVLQNNPAFVIGLLAAWRCGGIASAISPMSKQRELDELLADCEPSAMLMLDDVYESVARDVLASGRHAIHTVVTVSPLDSQTRSDPRLFAGVERRRPGDTLDLSSVIATGPARASEPPATVPSDIAVIAYTSGTTGFAKGAMLSHGNLAFNAQTYRDWTGLQQGEPVLALGPVFHVSGLVGGVLLALLLGSPLVLTHRYEATSMLDAIREHRPTFAVAAVTAFIGLVDDAGGRPDDFASFRWLYSGGSPVEPDVADRLEAAMGHYLHNVYGQTETASPSHAVPAGLRAPVDEATGALSVGLPVFNTVSRVVDDDGVEVPVGEIGEIVTAGPQVVAGYWRQPEASAEALSRGELRTGDVGLVDAAGWFYVVDRRKDLINASGFKVWPREVEMVLQAHPDVREVAVVGIPDEYRGESVKAFIALHPGATVTEVDLIDFSRERLAAFKYPREVEVVGQLPRTATGKILRKRLRDRA